MKRTSRLRISLTRVRACLALSIALGLISTAGSSADQDGAKAGEGGTHTLDETRLVMSKWIETQQIISKERNEWQQGKEILVGRLDLVKKEIASLEDKINQTESSVTESS